MNIAVFGWYHHRNAGDDRMQACLTRWLEGHTLAFLPAGRPPPVAMLATYDAAIIGGGGLIMRRGGVFRDMARWIRAAGIPVALAGVSVEGLDDSLRRELRDFLDHCSFAWFRDQGSLDAVGSHPNAFVAPDISWLYPYPRAATAGSGVAVTLRPGNNLPIDGWRQALSALPGPLHAWPLYFEGGGDAAVLARVLGPENTVPEEPTLAPLRAASVALTGRFHGLMFALQLGRPAITVSSTPKVRRFLEQNSLDGHGLEQWRIDEDQPAALAALWPEFMANQDLLTDVYDRLRDRLRDQVWSRTEAARERLLEQAGALPAPGRRPRQRFRQLLDLGRWL